jgi:hypothetical protein
MNNALTIIICCDDEEALNGLVLDGRRIIHYIRMHAEVWVLLTQISTVEYVDSLRAREQNE